MEKILNWKLAVEHLVPSLLNSDQKDVASLVTQARQYGIGKAISYQTTSYSDEDIYKLEKLLKLWQIIDDVFANEWRDKKVTAIIQKIIITSLLTATNLNLYAVFCPSYKKGLGAYGYSGICGSHTIKLISKISDVYKKIKQIGVDISITFYFSDLLLENYDKLIGTNYRKDLDLNYQDFVDKVINASQGEIEVQKLSDLPTLSKVIGEKGIEQGGLGVPEDIFERVYNRNLVFYKENLGWSDEEVLYRSQVLARCYSYMGDVFRKLDNNNIMIWTESAYERGIMYSGIDLEHPIPILYFNKNE